MKKTCLHLALFASLSVIALNSSQTTAAQKRDFTPEDALNRTQLFDTTPRPYFFDVRPFLISPDQKRLFVITGTGDAKALTYTFKLLMYDTAELLKYADGKAKGTPAPVVLAQLDYRMDSPHRFVWSDGGIRDLRFYDNGQKLIFLGADQKGITQVYSVDLATRKLIQITRSLTEVGNFRVLEQTGELVYATGQPAMFDKNCRQISYSLENTNRHSMTCIQNGLSLNEAAALHRPSVRNVSYYRQSLTKDSEPIQLLANVTPMAPLDSLPISQDGRKMIMSIASWWPPEQFEKAYRKSATVKQYIDALKSYHGNFDPNTHESHLPYTYYGVMDLETGRFRPFIDLISSAVGSDEPKWVNNNQVYLPAVEHLAEDGTSPTARLVTNGSHAGVYVDLANGRYTLAPTKISAQSGNQAGSKRSQFDEWQKNHYIFDEPDHRRRCVRNSEGEDHSVDGRPACFLEIKHLGLMIISDERYDRLPSIVVANTRTGKKRTLLELNPHYKQIKFGRVEPLKWKDTLGYEWSGALVYPPEYQPSKRYPLIVQPEGFDPNSFQINGTYFGTAPHATRAWASKDIIVLLVSVPTQIPFNGSYGHNHRARAVNSAIRLLDHRGLIDTSKIGLIGFSGYGHWAFNMTVFPEYRPAATMVVDAVSPSPFSYAILYKSQYPGVNVVEEMACGARPWGRKQAEWLRRNPYYHLDKIRTPVYIVKNDSNIPDWLDIFAGMRRLNIPVEARNFNTFGQHPVTIPEAVLESQRHAIDWFDFWLNGREDSDPAKQEQYERWREMRTQLAKLGPVKEPAVPYSQMDCEPSAGVKSGAGTSTR